MIGREKVKERADDLVRKQEVRKQVRSETALSERVLMHTRNIILKARQLGFTTEVCIIQLDAALFEAARCALIAHTLNDAKRLFREKIKYAYDRLPDEIKAANPASNDAAGGLVFKKGGSLYISTSFRGGTLRYPQEPI